MPNDAKLGLLAGVVGVIIAATITGKSPTSLGTAISTPSVASPQPSAALKNHAKANDVATPALLPAELSTTPVVRTKPDVEATATARTARKNEEK
jgi:hypothetical protein